MKRVIAASLLILAICSQASAIDRLKIKQGSTLPSYRVPVVDSFGAAVDLTGCTVTASMRADGNSVNAFTDALAVIAAPPTAGVFIFYWSTSQTAKAGTYTIQFTVRGPRGTFTIPTGTLAPVTIERRY
jgi:hypothetical protein